MRRWWTSLTREPIVPVLNKSHQLDPISGNAVPVVALVGNPNTGKTSLFNALTGYRRHVANYPGVTVEAASGRVRQTRTPLELLDLPGTYSLAAASPDELLVGRVLVGEQEGAPRPDAILAIVDATNLPRNLYLVSQLLDTGLPLVVAVNMMDIAAARGIEIDCATLSQRLGAPVIPIVATRPRTLSALAAALDGILDLAPPSRVEMPAGTPGDRAAEVRLRYAWLAEILKGVIQKPERSVITFSDRLDAFLTHKLYGALFLILVLYVVFQSIFRWAKPLMDAIAAGFGELGDFVGQWLPEGALRSLITDGVIAGAGGVLVFVPQILILFAFIAILEDCGYLARAAFMMDRLMRTLGLSGRAFIPLLSSFACAVPAIMGTRTIADRRERFVTILIAPFMSCSARLPVYLLLIGAFVPATKLLGGWLDLRAVVMLTMYLTGVIVAIPVAWLLKSTLFRGPSSSFILEMPSYKWPRPMAVLHRMYGAGKKFVVGVGTVILLVNLVVWALGYFPRSHATRAAIEAQRIERGWDDDTFDKELAGAYLRESFLGRMGHFIEPAVRPIGWDWRIGVAVIASFPAREVVVATMGTIYGLGREEDKSSQPLREAIQAATWPDANPATQSKTITARRLDRDASWPKPGSPVFTLPVALSIMVFFALCAQCSSTLVTIGRETRSWRWPVASFIGMTTIAYFAAWAVAAASRACGL